jgi:hypothetical protein
MVSRPRGVALVALLGCEGAASERVSAGSCVSQRFLGSPLELQALATTTPAFGARANVRARTLARVRAGAFAGAFHRGIRC